MERLVTRFLRAGIRPAQVGVITPYEGQRAHLVQIMQQAHQAVPGMAAIAAFQEVEVASVDAFQVPVNNKLQLYVVVSYNTG